MSQVRGGTTIRARTPQLPVNILAPKNTVIFPSKYKFDPIGFHVLKEDIGNVAFATYLPSWLR